MKPALYRKVKETIKNNPELYPHNIYKMFIAKYGEPAVGDWLLYNRKPKDYWDDFDRVIKSARQYNTAKEWQRNAPGAVGSARRNGWLDESISHMTPTLLTSGHPVGHWDIKENLLQSALKYKTRSAWQKGASTAYKRAKSAGCFEECVAHMESKLLPVGHWSNYENVLASAQQCDTQAEWKKKYASAMNSARKNGWIESMYRSYESKE